MKRTCCSISLFCMGNLALQSHCPCSHLAETAQAAITAPAQLWGAWPLATIFLTQALQATFGPLGLWPFLGHLPAPVWHHCGPSNPPMRRFRVNLPGQTPTRFLSSLFSFPELLPLPVFPSFSEMERIITWEARCTAAANPTYCCCCRRAAPAAPKNKCRRRASTCRACPPSCAPPRRGTAHPCPCTARARACSCVQWHIPMLREPA